MLINVLINYKKGLKLIETLDKSELEDYKNSIKTEKLSYLKKSASIIKQYLLAKNNILEAIKETFLFPYLLEMEYLIGTYEGVVVSDSPTETLPYFKMPNGLKELMNIDIDNSTLNNWNVFRLKIPIKDKYSNINYFNTYAFIRIAKSIDYFFFSFYEGKIFTQELTLTMLDKQPAINDIKYLINNSKEQKNEEVDNEPTKNTETSNN